MVYVLDINGNPLMPTSRHGKVRRMLDSGMAEVVRRTPFTIRLKYETTAYLQYITLGVDAGSKVIGLSATTEKKELYRSEITLRNDVVNVVSTRRESRRTRRNHKTRYRKPRFDNRRKPEGWLAPSVRQKAGSHVRAIELVTKILPVAEIVVETAQFDLQKIKNPDVCGEQYQQGEQLGFWNTREYVLFRDGHECQCCHGKSKDKILNIHHIESRKTGGDSPDNLVTLCETCHKAYHAGKIELKLKRKSKSLRDAALMNVMRWNVYNKLKQVYPDKNVRMTYGYITKNRRILHGIEKTHCADAFCIAGNLHAKRSDILYKGRCVARHSRSLHDFLPVKGGLRISCVASHWITVPARGKRPAVNTRLQRFDTVRYMGRTWLIAGSSNGRPILRDINWNAVGKSPTVNHKKVKFLNRKHGSILLQIINNQRINTCET